MAMNDHRVARRRHRERGQTLWLVALCLLVLIGMAALAIDVTTLYAARSQMQRTADAAALGGAKAFVDSGTTTAPTVVNLQTLAKSLAGDATHGYIAAVLAQNKINGVVPSLATAPTFDFTTHPGNPEITVTVQRTNLPTFFARIFGQKLATVSATATAEAYNSSNPGSGSNMPPIAPRCVKPWFIPNLDPRHANGPFVNSDGTIANPGVWTGGASCTTGTGGGVIGECMHLVNIWETKCGFGNGASCITPPLPSPLTAAAGYVGYLPANIPSTSGPCPSCSVGLPSDFATSVACCDTANVYACGGTSPSIFIDLVHQRAVSTLAGAECLLNGTSGSSATVGDDTINLGNFFMSGGTDPIEITAGNPPHSGQLVTTSNQVVTVPIIDTTLVDATAGQVKVIGFMQVFVQQTYSDGDVDFYVLNISGCGSNVNTSATAITGGGVSPIPVRLIHQ
jgi:Flp pilus assembly protein TadG